MPFYRTPFWLPLLYPDFTWRVRTKQKVIYLSFDDGPVPGPTDFVLDTLRQFNAKATFFCVGDNVSKHPLTFDRIIAEGHAYGNHTHNHINGWKTETGAYIENFKKCQEQIPETKLFRPPYGRIKRKQAAIIKASHRIIMWDVLSMDYRQDLSESTCLSKSIQSTQAGSIIVFHDSYKAEKNLEYVLPRYLSHFGGKDYKFLSL